MIGIIYFEVVLLSWAVPKNGHLQPRRSEPHDDIVGETIKYRPMNRWDSWSAQLCEGLYSIHLPKLEPIGPGRACILGSPGKPWMRKSGPGPNLWWFGGLINSLLGFQWENILYARHGKLWNMSMFCRKDTSTNEWCMVSIFFSYKIIMGQTTCSQQDTSTKNNMMLHFLGYNGGRPEWYQQLQLGSWTFMMRNLWVP